MKFKENLKKQSYIITIVAIFLALAIGGVSYAFFFQVKSNSNYQVVKTGDLSVTSSVTGNVDSETELFPLSDSDATSGTTGFLSATVSVSNDGSLASLYDLVVDYDLGNLPSGKSSSDLLDQSYVGFAVYSVKSGTSTLLNSGTLGDCSLVSGSTTARKVLANQQLSSSSGGASTITYEIRVWIKDTITNDMVGKLLYLNTSVISEVDSSVELSS